MKTILSLAAIVAAAGWVFRHAITDRLRVAWRNLRLCFMPSGRADTDRLARLFREGRP